jgi:regulator of RNase E activity RraA
LETNDHRSLTSASSVELPIQGAPYDRATPELLAGFSTISTASASAALHFLGVSNVTVVGPTSRTPGAHIAGSAVTLQFMPRREDVVSGSDEEAEQHSALWAVFDDIRAGDLLVVQGYGDTSTGCLGEMLLSSLQGLGGLGAVVDGCIRDSPEVAKLDIPVWTKGVTPNFASQASLFPWAYDVPIACGGVLVLPGDVVLADGDGVVIVPHTLAQAVLDASRERQDWEDFSRVRLREGGALRRYYPLSDEAVPEYEAWRDGKGATG